MLTGIVVVNKCGHFYFSLKFQKEKVLGFASHTFIILEARKSMERSLLCTGNIKTLFEVNYQIVSPSPLSDLP